MSQKIDTITSEVVLNTFQSIAEEMSISLVRSAYSTNIKERKDCSCAIFDSKGNLIALAENIPIHLGSMQGLMNEIGRNLEKWSLHRGDILIANDPYLGGGSHLPDITLTRPVYYQNKLVAFVTNIAHWTDVGGRAPGVGTAGDSTEIYQEGLRIPPVKLMCKNILQKDVLEFIISNMRGRQEREGDLRAQISSLHLGERRLHELHKEYKPETISKVKDGIFDYSECWLQKAVQTVPEGSYHFTDIMDDDGISDERLPIKVTVTVTHKYQPSIMFDFTGTAPQATGGINMVRQALESSVYYSVKAIIAPDIPINAGFQRPIIVKAPKESLVNASEPAAVGGRTDTCQRVVDTIMGALAQAVPERIVAASNGATTAIILAGTKELSGSDFIYVEALGGGMGASSTKDGMDGVQVHITNTSNLPIEAMEMEYPLRILKYELVPDSGGAGQFRGGLAICKEIQALAPILFSAHSDRHLVSPWGLMGGQDGKRGRFVLNSVQPVSKRIKSKVSGVLIRKGDILRVQTAGGGGFGSPLKREPERVQKDFVQKKISRRHAREIYGVVFSRTGKIDQPATKLLKKKMMEDKDK
ncbi:MAG: hydantoinase B/oxoprolinase family protein [Candidatus Aminicenantaceae bacterium]